MYIENLVIVGTRNDIPASIEKVYNNINYLSDASELNDLEFTNHTIVFIVISKHIVTKTLARITKRLRTKGYSVSSGDIQLNVEKYN